MKVAMNFKSLSLQLHNKNNAFLAELIFQDIYLGFTKYVDYRKDVSLKSHSFYILHRPTKGVSERNMKAVAISPINSSNLVSTDSDFYNLKLVDAGKQGLVNSPNKRNKAHFFV